MTESDIQMTRSEMQTEALIIESLLNAVMALHCGSDTHDALNLIEMAQDRASRLNRALDAVNFQEGAE